MKETRDNSNDPILEECLQALRVHGENLRRQQRLSDSIDRMAAAAPPARRRPLFLYYTLGGVAACLALFFLTVRFSSTPPKPMPDAEMAQLQPVQQPQQDAPAVPEQVAGMGQMPGKVQLAETAAMLAARASVEPEKGDFALAVTAAHPQPDPREAAVADAVPALWQPSADTALPLPLPADSLPMATPAAEIFTLHTLVSYTQPVRERKLRLPFRRSAEQRRESSPVTSMLTINLQTTNH